jgi:hypothetical protein
MSLSFERSLVRSIFMAVAVFGCNIANEESVETSEDAVSNEGQLSNLMVFSCNAKSSTRDVIPYAPTAAECQRLMRRHFSKCRFATNISCRVNDTFVGGRNAGPAKAGEEDYFECSARSSNCTQAGRIAGARPRADGTCNPNYRVQYTTDDDPACTDPGRSFIPIGPSPYCIPSSEVKPARTPKTAADLSEGCGP